MEPFNEEVRNMGKGVRNICGKNDEKSEFH
jgi:hypothetical protein